MKLPILIALAFAFMSSLTLFLGNIVLSSKHTVFMKFVYRTMLLSFLVLGVVVIWSLS